MSFVRLERVLLARIRVSFTFRPVVPVSLVDPVIVMYYSSISFVFLITCTACAFATADRNPGRSQDELQSSLAGMLEQQLQQGPGGQIEVLQKEVAPDPGPGPESDADGESAVWLDYVARVVC